MIRLVCYIINALATFVLGCYFLKEFINKRLKASLAWGIGFLMWSPVIANLAFMATVEISKVAVMGGFVITSIMVALLYYGASLLFFNEESFFREKFTVIYFLATLFVGLGLAYVTPAGEGFVEKIRGPSSAMYTLLSIVIGTLFLKVSRRLNTTDPRRKTITLVAAGWYIIGLWEAYIGLAWLEYPSIEAIIFLLGSFGFILLLYGMTTGKTTK